MISFMRGQEAQAANVFCILQQLVMAVFKPSKCEL